MSVDLAPFRQVVGDRHVLSGATVHEDYTHDEAMTVEPVIPLAVVLPGSTQDVSDILRHATRANLPVVARGSGTGLSGGCQPVADGILLAFDRMKAIKEIDTENQVAVVEPGVTLEQLDRALAPLGLIYPVSPGEPGASLGGNVATNAGGMRAVRYGVTRQHVLGLEVVLADGTVMRTGGKFVKVSSGYDLTQLLIGSEGTLAVTTEITLKVAPRLADAATILAPFATLAEVAQAVPHIVSSGVDPSILEYIDVLAMAGITASAGLDLGIPEETKAATMAYLVVVLEGMQADRVEEDVERLATLLSRAGALDVFVLPATAGAQLISAREKAFFVAKASGADDIVDAVIPARGDSRIPRPGSRARGGAGRPHYGVRSRRRRQCPSVDLPARPGPPPCAVACDLRHCHRRRGRHRRRARHRDGETRVLPRDAGPCEPGPHARHQTRLRPPGPPRARSAPRRDPG